jgi:hypothetical protein
MHIMQGRELVAMQGMRNKTASPEPGQIMQECLEDAPDQMAIGMNEYHYPHKFQIEDRVLISMAKLPILYANI